MAAVEAIVLFLGLMFAIPIAWGVGLLIAKVVRVRWIALIPPAAIIIGVFGVGPMLIARAGVPVRARIAALDEHVTVKNDGDWSRHYRIQVQYLPGGATDSVVAQVAVKRAIFDQLRSGQTVDARYLSQIPGFIRVSDAGVFDWLPEGVYFGPVGYIVVLMVAPMLFAMWLYRSRSGRTQRVVIARFFALAWFGALAFSVVQSFRQPPEPLLDAEATATIAGTSRIISSPLSARRFYREVDVPFDLIELRVRPAGGGSVTAVDAVDAGSIVGLTSGATVRVRHRRDDPRVARVASGERTHRSANLAGMWRDAILLLIVPAVGVLMMAVLTGKPARNQPGP